MPVSFCGSQPAAAAAFLCVASSAGLPQLLLNFSKESRGVLSDTYLSYSIPLPAFLGTTIESTKGNQMERVSQSSSPFCVYFWVRAIFVSFLEFLRGFFYRPWPVATVG